MKLLLDQGLPRSAASMMREGGVDAVHTAEIGAATASDAEILRMGQETGRVVVTLDADFHSLLALSGAKAPSVIRIRVEGLDAVGLVNLLRAVLKQCAQDLEQGAAVSVSESRVRVRRLPIV
jgi:predicted nuclease of predicted toxin-antitoxin system